MVTDKADYRFVTGLDGIRIDGGIMPNRSEDTAAPVISRKDAIRGEDIAFAAEAVNECGKVLKVNGAVVCDMTDTRLLGSRVRSIAQALNLQAQPPTSSIGAYPCRTSAQGAVRSIATFPPSISPPSWSLAANMATAFGDIISYPSTDIDDDQFLPGREAKRQDIEDLLTATQAVKASVACVDSVGRTELTGTRYYADPDGSSTTTYLVPPSSSIGWLYYYNALRGSGVMSWRWSVERINLNGGNYYFDEAAHGIPYTHRGYAALRVTNYTSRNGGESVSGGVWVDLVPMTINIFAGQATIEAGVVRSALMASLAAHGCNEIEPTEEGFSQTIRAEPIGFAVQRIRGDHTLYEAD